MSFNFPEDEPVTKREQREREQQDALADLQSPMIDNGKVQGDVIKGNTLSAEQYPPAASTPEVVADPKKPSKALVGALLAAASIALAEYSEFLPGWLVLILGGLVTGGAVFGVKNPTMVKQRTRRNERGAVTGNNIWFILGVVGLVLIVLLLVGVL